MSKNEKGFYLFFDWIERLKELPFEEAIKVVYSICEYYKSGTDPTKQFKGSLKIVVALMFDQIKRGEKISEIRAEAGQKGGFAKAKDSKKQICHNLPEQNVATYNNITNNNITNTTTTTTVYSACAQDNVENSDVENSINVENYDDVEFKIIEYFNKNHFVSSALDFIAYNKAREWKGIGGEDVREDYTRYADRWEDEERRKKGLY